MKIMKIIHNKNNLFDNIYILFDAIYTIDAIYFLHPLHGNPKVTLPSILVCI